jgi:putative ABC transport system permease protein
VGGPVTVRIGDRNVSFPIVGVVKELSPMPVIYAAPAAVVAATGRRADMARTIRIVTLGHDDAAQRGTAQSLERAFERAGIEVAGMQRMADARQGILDHLVIILAILTMATVIVVFVGALALTSTLTLNVVQRTRDIGVLGAIGATPGVIARQIWFEAVVIGVLSWGLAVLVSAPLSYLLGATCGNIFFRAPLDFYMSPGAAAMWLGWVVVLASLSGAVPALRAARLTVREALAYA